MADSPAPSDAAAAPPAAFPAALFDVLACPVCRTSIPRPAPGAADSLACVPCGRTFPIVRGVPRFSAELGDMREVARSFGFQWEQQSRGAFEQETLYGETEDEEVTSFFQRFDLPLPPRPDSLRGLRILDAGCGSGRLTARLGRCGADLVVGLDISEGVNVAARHCAGLPNVAILQGDLLHPPLRPASFDLIWSEGVLHHTPHAHAAFLSLATCAADRGRVYVWLYPRDFNAYRFVRRFLPLTWALPSWLMMVLCRLLAGPLWVAARIRGWLRPGGARTWRQIVFGLHDNLSPRYQSRHTNDELSSWFHCAGLEGVRPTGPATGVVGHAPAANPAAGPATGRAESGLAVLVVTNAFPTHAQPWRGAFIKSQIASLRRLGLRVHVETIAGYRGKSEYLRAIFRVRRLARDGHFDLLHAHYGLTGIVSLCQSRLPVVVSFMGDDVYGTPDRQGRYSLMSRLIARMSRVVGRRAEAVIVKSEELKRALGRADAHVIPNGVDFDFFRPLPRDEARRRIGLDPDRPIVLFAGQPELPVKDHPLAAEAVRRLGLVQSNPQLLVAGRLPQEEMPWYYNAADVLLLTSRHEGSPNSVKEAAACNLPIVSVDVGDVRRLLGGVAGVRIVESRDPEDLAVALAETIGETRRSGAREAITELSLERIARRILGVYRSVLPAPAGPRPGD